MASGLYPGIFAHILGRTGLGEERRHVIPPSEREPIGSVVLPMPEPDPPRGTITNAATLMIGGTDVEAHVVPMAPAMYLFRAACQLVVRVAHGKGTPFDDYELASFEPAWRLPCRACREWLADYFIANIDIKEEPNP